MDGSGVVGLANQMSLTDTGVIIFLFLIILALGRHIRSDRADRRRGYERLEAMEGRLTAKIEEVRTRPNTCLLYTSPSPRD